jgi:hypothetical protein
MSLCTTPYRGHIETYLLRSTHPPLQKFVIHLWQLSGRMSTLSLLNQMIKFDATLESRLTKHNTSVVKKKLQTLYQQEFI